MPLAIKPKKCSGCPAEKIGLGFVPPEGRGKTVFLGQGPGESEAYSSRPFHPEAPSGRLLTRWINRSGYQRTEIWLGNAVQCYLKKGKKSRDPTPAEIKWCWNAHVGPWLHKVKPELIFTVGAPATRWIKSLPPTKAVEAQLGTVESVELPPLGENDGHS